MSDGFLCGNPDCARTRELLQKAQDEIAGHIWTQRSQSSKIGKYRREEQSVSDHAQWKRCARLFRVWQRATGHTRSRFTAARFREALPYLTEYEDEVIERAIMGLAFDPFTSRRKNGTVQRHDGWHLLWKESTSVEEYANKAPLDWKETLEEHAAEVASR